MHQAPVNDGDRKKGIGIYEITFLLNNNSIDDNVDLRQVLVAVVVTVFILFGNL